MLAATNTPMPTLGIATVGISAVALTAFIILYRRALHHTIRMAGDDAMGDPRFLREKISSQQQHHSDQQEDAEEWACRPFTLARGVEMRNRFMKAATFESAARKGKVTDELIRFHVDQGQHLAMTTVAYGCVSQALPGSRKTGTTSKKGTSGLTFTSGAQLLLQDTEECRRGLRRLTSEVKAKTSNSSGGGCRCSIQLTHAGLMAEQGDVVGPNLPRQFSLSALKFARGLRADDIADLVQCFANAAKIAKECGFDAVEIHCGHGYLLSQFISPVYNQRAGGGDDPYSGATVESRSRFALDVIRAVRAAVGEEKFLVFVKMNAIEIATKNAPTTSKVVDDSGGADYETELAQSSYFAQLALEAGADFLIPSCGLILKNGLSMMRGSVPRWEMVTQSASIEKKIGLGLLGPWLVPNIEWRPLFMLKPALSVVERVKEMTMRKKDKKSSASSTTGTPAPFVYIGGVTTPQDIETLYQCRDSFSMIVTARAVLRDNKFPLKVQRALLLQKKNNHQKNNHQKDNPCSSNHVEDLEDLGPLLPCDQCNKCIVSQMSGGLTECVHRRIHGK